MPAILNMALTKILYPIDLTGTATSNHLEGEMHELGTDKYRAIALNGGPFFADSLEVRDVANNRLLDRGVDYECVYYIPTLSKRAAGKEICGVLLVHNLNVSPKISVDYNFIGGHYSSNVYAIQQAIDALKLDERKINFEDIFNKPDSWTAGPHAHDIADFYGFEYIISVLTTLNDNVSTGNSLELEALQAHITTLIGQVKQQLDAHKTDYNNPHKVSRTQLNVMSVEEVNALIEQVNREIQNLEPRFSDIAKQFKAATDTIATLTTTLTSLSGRIGDVEEQHGTYELRFADLNDRLDGINNAINAINVTLGDLRQADIRIRQLIDDLDDEVSALKVRDRELAASIQENEDAIGRLDAKHQADVRALNDRINALQAEMQELKDHTAVIESVVKRNSDIINSHGNTINSLGSTVSTLSSRLAGMRQDARSGTYQITGLRPGKKYLVSVYGVISNRGTGNTSMVGVRVSDERGRQLAATQGRWINWPDGSGPHNAVLLITAPSSGIIRGYTDGGDAMNMVAWSVSTY